MRKNPISAVDFSIPTHNRFEVLQEALHISRRRQAHGRTRVSKIPVQQVATPVLAAQLTTLTVPIPHTRGIVRQQAIVQSRGSWIKTLLKITSFALLLMTASAVPNFGQYTFPEGQGVYEGPLVNGLPDGAGVVTTTNDAGNPITAYRGGFCEGHPVGPAFGYYTFGLGQRYEGELFDGRPKGRGKIYSPDGKARDVICESNHASNNWCHNVP